MIINSGWYVSQAQYMELGLEAPIYKHLNGSWYRYVDDSPVAVTDLPEAPQAMWPLRLLQR